MYGGAGLYPSQFLGQDAEVEDEPKKDNQGFGTTYPVSKPDELP